MNCLQILFMKYFVAFLSTFLIYFGVFGFLDYKGIIGKIMNFLMKIPEKILNFISGLIPTFIKNFFKKFISPIYNFFSKSIPEYFNKKKKEVKKPLEERLAELKKKEDEMLKNKKSKSIFVFMDWFNSAFSKIKVTGQTFWEKLKDVILAGFILSIFYYIIWYFIMVVLVNILKYLINTASGGQEILEQMQAMTRKRDE